MAGGRGPEVTAAGWTGEGLEPGSLRDLTAALGLHQEGRDACGESRWGTAEGARGKESTAGHQRLWRSQAPGAGTQLSNCWCGPCSKRKNPTGCVIPPPGKVLRGGRRPGGGTLTKESCLEEVASERAGPGANPRPPIRTPHVPERKGSRLGREMELQGPGLGKAVVVGDRMTRSRLGYGALS